MLVPNLGSANHKEMSILYILFSICSGLFGFSFSFMVCWEHLIPFYIFGGGQLYSILIAGHSLVMIFFLVVPALLGLLVNFFDISFSWISSLSFWLLPVSFFLLTTSIMLDEFWSPLLSIFSLHLGGGLGSVGLSCNFKVLVKISGKTRGLVVCVILFLLMLTMPVLVSGFISLVVDWGLGFSFFFLIFSLLPWSILHPEFYVLVIFWVSSYGLDLRGLFPGSEWPGFYDLVVKVSVKKVISFLMSLIFSPFLVFFQGLGAFLMVYLGPIFFFIVNFLKFVLPQGGLGFFFRMLPPGSSLDPRDPERRAAWARNWPSRPTQAQEDLEMQARSSFGTREASSTVTSEFHGGVVNPPVPPVPVSSGNVNISTSVSWARALWNWVRAWFGGGGH